MAARCLSKVGKTWLLSKLHGSHRQLVGIQPSPSVAAVAVDGRLHIGPVLPL